MCKAGTRPPKFSVIIPTHDRCEMTGRAVRSVLAQTCDDYELIVVDDGSREDLTAVADLVKEAGQRFERQEQQGVSAARNFGVAHSSGDWLAFLDSDDEWLPDKLEKQRVFIGKNPDLKIAQTDEIWIRNGQRVNKKKYHRFADGDGFALSLERCSISPSSVVIKRALFNQAAGFDETLPACEDYDLWLRITCKEKVGFIDEELIVKYGGHPDQLSSTVPALDLYRVVAMLKLVSERELDHLQRRRLLSELVSKVSVLCKGAGKYSLRSRDLLSELKEATLQLETDVGSEALRILSRNFLFRLRSLSIHNRSQRNRESADELSQEDCPEARVVRQRVC